MNLQADIGADVRPRGVHGQPENPGAAVRARHDAHLGRGAWLPRRELRSARRRSPVRGGRVRLGKSTLLSAVSCQAPLDSGSVWYDTRDQGHPAELIHVQRHTMIEARGLGKMFTLHNQGGIRLPVLDAVDFTASAGECLVLAGPSGAGKSTLLRCLYGNYLATEGSIRVRNGEEWVELVGAPERASWPAPRGWLSASSCA